MRDEPVPIDPERLLVEDPFVRGLARQLLRDPDRAEDLAQRTWLLLLRERVAAVSLRGFVATVMRRLAQRERRGAMREADKVAALPRPEAVPSAATIAAREEMRARVVEAVLALPEPYREVVLLRFFEHLPPRAIARRLQLPVETVRTRQKRALAQLRGDLDDGRGRAAWVALLAPFARPAPAAAAVAAVAAIEGAMAMATKSKAVAAVAACAVLFWIGAAMLRGGSDGAPSLRDGTSPAVAAAAPVAAPTALPEADTHADAPARSAAAAVPAPTTGSLAVAVVWEEDQQPAAAVVVALGGDDAPGPETRGRATTDQGGIATFDDVPAGRLHVTLSRRKPKPEWPLATIAAGERTELRLAVQRGLTASGIVVDSAGHPIAGAEILVAGWSGGEGVPLATSGRDGRFAVRAIETACHIGARAVGFAASPLQQCMSKAGADVELRIELTAPSAELTGTVQGPDGAPVVGALVQAGTHEQGIVRRPDGATVMAPRPELARTDGSGRYALRAQGAGAVPFCVRANGLAAHQQVVDLQVGKGNVCDVHLVAGVTLVGSVRDSNGQPLEAVGIAVGEWNAPDRRWVRSGSDGAFRLADLAVGPLPVAVEAEAHGRASKVLQGVAGETLRWDVVLEAGLTLRGRVLDADGAPADNVMVEAEAARAHGDNWRGSTRTDAAGRFELRGCAADQAISIDLQRYGMFRDLHIDGVRPTADELVLRLPPRPRACIVGRVLLADGRVPQNVAVSPELEGMHSSPVESVDAATGAFRIGPYPPGDYRLRVQAPGFPTILLRGRLDDGGADWDVGSLQLEPGGTLRVDLVADTTASLPRHWLNVLDGDGMGVAQLDDDGGAARAGPLRPGDYVLQLGGDGLVNAQVPFAVSAGVETHLQVPVHAGVRALLTVTVPEGEDLRAAVQVAIADRSGAPVYRGVLWCNGRGATTPTMLDPGTYAVAVWRGARRTAAEWTVPATGTAELELRLQ